ncbi:MAG: DUF192 domain-containing protein [Phaeodactylibacter sp.]|nr:DUF192 domain-containing protein [Phaeodactylibacter sp.]MCB9048661.1 DUF192 domain-containing protein [Lewinellaceae bacterium]
MARRKKPNRAERRQAEQSRRRNLKWLVIALALALAGGLIYIAIPKTPKAPEGPQFTKQGELQFLDKNGGSLIKTIDIEIKKDPQERNTGMMWRRSMEDTQGMLFIMDRPEPQSFWMRNTYIPLDIIFVDENFKILNIRANAQPQTLDSQSSIGNALYVVEVVGGFCAQYGIDNGDEIRFQQMN